MANSFGSYVSNRGESTLLAVVSKGGSAALAGGIQWRIAPLSGRKNPMKPAVSWHTTLCANSFEKALDFCSLMIYYINKELI